MIVLRPIETAQTLKFIPREYNATKVVLVDESTNTEVEINATFTQDKYYLTADIAFSLIEGRFYNLTVYNVNDIVYKDKVFCTSQNVLDYSINKDVYTSNVTDNEYIIL
jgi:hypothetical protein